MKRSEINKAIKESIELLEENNLKLPDFAYWTKAEWQANSEKLDGLKETMLGWDVTDFGSGDFENCGAVLFTIRNGKKDKPEIGTPYAEKLIFMKDGSEQEIPFHYHSEKTEDIINRGGGILTLELYGSKADGTLDSEGDVEVFFDGIPRTLPAGAVVEVQKGNSITLTSGLFHRFWTKKGSGALVAGEVSSINDDNVDNTFLVKRTRFSQIEEDEETIWPLCNEYDSFLDK